MGHGGKRVGAGKPKGSKAQRTLDRESLRQRYVELQAQRLSQVSDAQFEAALGVSHMMAKDKQGKWVEVTDPKDMKRVLDSGETFYKIYANNPNANAARDIIDQIIGKAPQSVELSGNDKSPITHVVRWEK